MASDVPLRHRRCRCGATFYICRPCDRGQRYCSDCCRQKARREQRRETNRRHQQSPEGRLDHRDRQQRYRQRLRVREKCVTDQASPDGNRFGNIPHQESVAAPVSMPSIAAFCIRCGRYMTPSRTEVNVNNEPTYRPATQEQEYVRREALHEWIARLQERFRGRLIAVAIEQRKGAVIHALMMYAFFVLYPINPKALARYREAFHTSGAKDDPTDSELLLDFLSKHSEKLRPWIPDAEPTRMLQALCEQRRKLVHRRVALTNRITSLLKQYFP